MKILVKLRLIVVLLILVSFTNCKNKNVEAFKSSPNDSSIICFQTSRTKKYNVLLSSFDGIYFSNAGTESWKYVSKQPVPSNPIENIFSHPHIENVWFAFSHRSIYITKDNGKSWTQRINGLQKQNKSLKKKIESLSYIFNKSTKMQNTWDIIDLCYPFYLKNTFYCATTNGIFVFKNGAKSWQKMPKILSDNEFILVNDISEMNSFVAVDSMNNVFLYNYKDETIQNKGKLLIGDVKDILTIYDNKLLAITTEGLFEWTVSLDYSIEDTVYPLRLDKEITGGVYESGLITILSNNQILYSSDFGVTWVKSDIPLEDDIINVKYDKINERYYILSKMHGIFHSDNLVIWNNRQKQIHECTINRIYGDISPKTKLYALTNGNGIFCSYDHGKVWQPSNDGMSYLDVKDIIITTHDSHRIYAGTINNGLYYSLNKGKNWMSQNSVMESLTIDAISFDVNDPRHIIVGTWNKKYEQSEVYYTTNDGWDWYPIIFPSRITSILSMKEKKEQHWVGTRHGLYELDTETLNYYNTDFTKTITCMKQDPFSQNTIYVGTMSGLFVSYDNGQTFTNILNKYKDKIGSISDIIVDSVNKGTIYFASGNQFYMTTNEGIEWMKQTSKNNKYLFTCLFTDIIDSGVIYAGTKNNGVVYSNSKGKNWHISDNKLNK